MMTANVENHGQLFLSVSAIWKLMSVVKIRSACILFACTLMVFLFRLCIFWWMSIILFAFTFHYIQVTSLIGWGGFLNSSPKIYLFFPNYNFVLYILIFRTCHQKLCHFLRMVQGLFASYPQTEPFLMWHFANLLHLVELWLMRFINVLATSLFILLSTSSLSPNHNLYLPLAQEFFPP